MHAYDGFTGGRGRPVGAGPCQSGLVSSYERHAQRTGEQALWGLHAEVGPRGLGLGQQLAVWAYPSLKMDWIWVKIWAIKWA